MQRRATVSWRAGVGNVGQSWPWAAGPWLAGGRPQAPRDREHACASSPPPGAPGLNRCARALAHWAVGARPSSRHGGLPLHGRSPTGPADALPPSSPSPAQRVAASRSAAPAHRPDPRRAGPVAWTSWPRCGATSPGPRTSLGWPVAVPPLCLAASRRPLSMPASHRLAAACHAAMQWRLIAPVRTGPVQSRQCQARLPPSRLLIRLGPASNHHGAW